MSLWNCRWIVRQTRNRPDLAWARDLARLTQVSLVIYLVTGAALSMGDLVRVYVLVAVLSRCRRVVSKAVVAGRVSIDTDPWDVGGEAGLLQQTA